MNTLAKLLSPSLLIVTACALPVHETSGQLVPGVTLSSMPRIVILEISDGQERGQDATHGSGQAMGDALRERLMGHGIAVQSIQSKELEQGYNEATRIGFDYVLRGVFTNWEDNATAWSGNPDRAELAVELFSVADRRLAASADHKVQASGATLLSSTPMRFIPELADRTLGRIFGWPAPPPR
ncbi:MAG TPA: DUF4823 domain-containing protein [Candidatus Polarisedimenticolaceae bacterium]|nr:DUF4823 domain-containing protein [Candidatus Polarisedimenticolaceae bacterium]